MPFEQQMNFPTEVTLRTTANGIQMYRMPVSSISSLYEKRESWNNRTIKKGDNPFQEMNGELYDINLEIAMQQASSLDIGIRGAVIHYDAAKKSIKCGSPSIDEQTLSQNWWSPKRINITSSNNMGEAPLSPENGKIKLRILVDRTTIEIFGNDGQIVITSCFLPEKDNKSYSLTSNGEILLVNAEVHSLKSAWAN
jgi:fructan beta-(2,6)-fructosidase